MADSLLILDTIIQGRKKPDVKDGNRCETISKNMRGISIKSGVKRLFVTYARVWRLIKAFYISCQLAIIRAVAREKGAARPIFGFSFLFSELLSP